MDNEQFRRLLGSAPKQPDGRSPPTNRPSATPTVLGARKHSSIPMTPRNVGGKNNVNAEFARQLAERNAKANPAKRFKSSAPKGVKLAAGFIDRAQERKAKAEQEEEDERAERIKALEEAMKLGQIEREDFEKLVEEITGGELESTYLVKGLDRRLLDRVRKGEDVFTKKESPPKDDEAAGEDIDSDAEFEELEKKDVETIKREKAEKRGEMAPPVKAAPVAGVKRTRADILAELKAQRKAAAEAAEAERQKLFPSLGAGFRKVGVESTRIERDDKGREVLVITDAKGKEKRKVRKQKVEEVLVPKVLDDVNTHTDHMVIPAPKPEQEEEDDDGDIFEGVGSNFNPLADLDGSDDSSSDEEGAQPELSGAAKAEAVSGSEDGELASDSESERPATISQAPTEPSEKTSQPRRKWFQDEPTTAAAVDTKSSADATVLAALRKVRDMDATSSLLADTEEARLAKRAAELAARDRDMEDIDMGFGGSRFDDAEDMEREGEKVKFSEWKGLGAEDDGEDEDGKHGKGVGKRKRGPKKKKGDKNSATDILQAMERQDKAKTLG
ncbi:hypothetical protein BDV96DRAFT_575064 [Lophiotrema nucula]|uniref:RED-like N-terminal domain-containing protein n=1 Tax=Lophiotrema nucula TaxID=690887 RepID=A0A6A5Z6X3_9PLEO|nr:hypothetical protein BDV96DRAFT_575064 [Lophiotrema nucula]